MYPSLNSSFIYNSNRGVDKFIRIIYIFGFSILFLSLSSCATTSKVWKPYDRLSIYASDNLNPDGNKKPSPIQLKVYELSSRTTFDNQDFAGLFNNGQTLLSDELLSSKVLIVQPKEYLEHQINLQEKTKFIAILAAYRNIDEARWKHIYAVKPHGHYKHDISLSANAIIDGKIINKEDDLNSALVPENDPEDSHNYTGNPRKRGIIP